MSKQTPGPWYMHDYTELFGDDPMQICVSCDELTELTICYMGHALKADLKEARDNASLIAAAPDMLDDLQYRYEQNKCGCGHPACKRCEDDRHTLEVLRKAKGGTE